MVLTNLTPLNIVSPDLFVKPIPAVVCHPLETAD